MRFDELNLAFAAKKILPAGMHLMMKLSLPTRLKTSRFAAVFFFMKNNIFISKIT